MSEKITEDNGDLVVSANVLADYFNVSYRRILQLADDNIVVRKSTGEYYLGQSVRGYIESIRKKEDTEDIAKINKAKAAESLMHERLKKRKTELIVQQMEKKLLKADDVAAIWSTMAVAVKSKLLAIPVKLATQLLQMEDAKEVQHILKSEIADALNEISEFDLDKFDSEFFDEDDNNG